MPEHYVEADPYPWPYNGDLRPENTALIVIDMQTDFCGIGGYVDMMGYDISLTRAPIEPIQRLLAAMRARATTSSTRAKATAPTSPTCRPTSAGARGGSAPASATPGRAAASWCAASRAGTSSPSWRRCPASRSSTSRARARSTPPTSTDPARCAASSNLMLTGITTDVCVHTTMREANDRGFECLLLEDCCGATDPSNHAPRSRWSRCRAACSARWRTRRRCIEAIA